MKAEAETHDIIVIVRRRKEPLDNWWIRNNTTYSGVHVKDILRS